MYILPFYNMSMLMPRYFILQRLRSSSSFTKRFIAEGCAVGFCCGVLPVRPWIAGRTCRPWDRSCQFGDWFQGRLDSPVAGFRTLDLKNFSPSLMSWLVNHLVQVFFDNEVCRSIVQKEGGEKGIPSDFCSYFFLYGTNIWFFDKWQPFKDAIPSSFFHQLPEHFWYIFLPETGNPTAWFPCF